MTFFIGWWRHNDVIFQIFLTFKVFRDILPWSHHFDIITGRLGKWVRCTKFRYEKCNFRYLTHFHWPVTSFMTLHVRYFFHYKHSRDILLSCSSSWSSVVRNSYFSHMLFMKSDERSFEISYISISNILRLRWWIVTIL